MKKIRQALTNFINNHPDKNNYSFNQITNLSFLNDQMVSTLDIKFLKKGLELTKELVGWLEPKCKMAIQLSSLFARETEVVEKAFLQEMNLPLNYFSSKKSWTKQQCNARTALKEHPVWGKKLNQINKRHNKAVYTLLSQEDIDNLEIIGSFPTYIALLVFRTQITIDRAVCLNLDERANLLSKVNDIFKP